MAVVDSGVMCGGYTGSTSSAKNVLHYLCRFVLRKVVVFVITVNVARPLNGRPLTRTNQLFGCLVTFFESNTFASTTSVFNSESLVSGLLQPTIQKMKTGRAISQYCGTSLKRGS